MPDDDLAQALGRLKGWLAPRLRDDPELRDALAGLARAAAGWLDSLQPVVPTIAAPPAIPEPVPVSPPPAVEAPVVLPPPLPPPPLPVLPVPVVPAPLPHLPVMPAAVTPAPLRQPLPIPAPTPAPFFSSYGPPEGDRGDRELELLPLTTIADRCRVKADACRLVARRMTDPEAARDAAAVDALNRRALALPDCLLWMLAREPVVAIPKAWKDLAGAFAAAADAALMLHAWGQAPTQAAGRDAPRVLGLAAEAQSVLLYAVAEVREVRVDFDQVQLFAHVRSVARDRQVFIPKYLKREDRADPGSWFDVARRVAQAAEQYREVEVQGRTRSKLLSNLRFKLTQLRERPDASAGEWPRALELVDAVVAAGLPASSPELRDLLLPVLEDIPDDPPPSPAVQLVLREIDRYLDSRPEDTPPVRANHHSAEVAEIAQLLRGRELVLIGGQVRPPHKAALVRAFGLADVRWLCTPEHTSFTVFEPDVARPEVAVVVLAIRWSNHDYDGVRAYCEEYGKPLVRLPGGYNANQVAHHILTQAGDRLRSATAAAG